MNCLRVARAVTLNVLEAHPETDLALLTVWTDVIPTDDIDGARRAQKVLADPRVQHFYDPQRFVGQALAPMLGLKSMREIVERTQGDMQQVAKGFHPGYAHGPAALFDTVLFYPPGARWEREPTKPPEPAAYVTQLDPALYLDIDAKRFRFGDALADELKRLADALLAPAPEAAK